MTKVDWLVKHRWAWAAPMMLICLIIILFGGSLWVIQVSDFKLQQRELEAKAVSIQEVVRLELQGSMDYLELLAEQMANDAIDEQIFQVNASMYVADNPEIINVVWADADFFIRWTAPYEPNKQVIGLKLTFPEPERASQLARDSGEPVYTRPYDIIQGFYAFEVYVPVYREDEFLGIFGGVYSVDKSLEKIATENLSAQYHLSFLNDSGAMIAETAPRDNIDGRLIKKIPLDALGYDISLLLGQGSRGWGLREIILLLATVALIVGLDGGLWMLNRDVVGRQKAEAELREAYDELELRVVERTQELANANTALQRLAITDPLTECFNRRHFFELAQAELSRASRYDHALSIIMLDIDHFKRVNDNHGHAIGDQVLQEFVKICQENIRDHDILARYGGEEFVLLLPETHSESAQQMAERLREKTEQNYINTEAGGLSITVSLGVVSLSGKNSLTLDKLLDRADKALYQSKDRGRNRVTLWQEPESRPDTVSQV